MNVEELRELCISKKGVTEEFPFDERALEHFVFGTTPTTIDQRFGGPLL